MSRTRVRAEDLFCARCHRAVRLGAHHWPEGYLCAHCYDHALETYGTCTGCGTDRLTPGLDAHGGKLCTDCAGGLGDFTCLLCGAEACRYRRGVCGCCVVAERLRPLLDDGTGRVNPQLVPLFVTLRQANRPKSILTWLGYSHVRRNLQTLARGEAPLTHEGLSRLTPWRSVAYLRDLLVQADVLPPADRQLLFFQRTLAEKLPAVSNPGHRRLLELFTTWHLQHRLNILASRGAHRNRSSRPAANSASRPPSSTTSPSADAPSPSAPKPMSTPGTRATTSPGASPTPSYAGPCAPSTCRRPPSRTVPRATPPHSPNTSGSRCFGSSRIATTSHSTTASPPCSSSSTRSHSPESSSSAPTTSSTKTAKPTSGSATRRPPSPPPLPGCC